MREEEHARESMNDNGPADAGPFENAQMRGGDYEHFASAVSDADGCAGGVGFGA